MHLQSLGEMCQEEEGVLLGSGTDVGLGELTPSKRAELLSLADVGSKTGQQPEVTKGFR